MIKSFAELKRVLQPGVKLKVVRHDWAMGGKIVGQVRAIATVQTNGIQFEGNSWLYWNDGAAGVEIRENGFDVYLNKEKGQVMSYEFVTEEVTA